MLSVVLRPNTEPVDTESVDARREKSTFIVTAKIHLISQTKFTFSTSSSFLFAFTWHDNKGTLGLHGNQTGAKDAGSVGG